ncbi:MAG: hypothetical protein NC182_02730 [Prevotella sp.]|nr:hypothetical protein [Staphylococcus sp.]MCM1350099.1 hypothetical protein [Prevotella sp.]
MNKIEDKILSLLKCSNTSYKYFFLLACIELMENDKYTYYFSDLSKMMVADAIMYPDLMNRRFTKNDRLYDLVSYIVSEYTEILSVRTTKDIVDKINTLNDKYVSKMLKQIVLYAPYRLVAVSDFADNLKNVPDYKKNKMIEQMSFSYDSIYFIENKSIIWKQDIHNYIVKNKENLKIKVIEKIRNKITNIKV